MNFVFFVPDEMRAESTGCYGHPAAITPNLDRLASEGTRFDQCHVQHPVCTPSRCSFMTGWYPHVRGHRTLWHSLRPDEPNLLRYLKEAGYYVFWQGKNDLLATASLADSADHWGTSDRGLFGKNPYDFSDPRYYSFQYTPFTSRAEDHGDQANVEKAIEFLRSGPTQPFCIYLPLTFPHCPYSAPKHWTGRIDPAALPDLRPVDLPGKPDFHSLIRKYRRLDQLDDAHLRQINATYLEMIGYNDEVFGRLLDALDETGHVEDTAVFHFADHGDWAGDFGLVEKWPSGLDDTLTRVPLVARIPGGKSGCVVKEPVEVFDIMATTLELAGLKARHTHFARSLVPQLFGAPGDPKRAVFSEGGYDIHEAHCLEGHTGNPEEEKLTNDEHNIYYPKRKQQQEHPESVCRSVMIRTATHKLIHRARGVCELYDLTADPRELHNHHADPTFAPIRARLERRLLDWQLTTADVTPLDEDPRNLPPCPRNFFEG
jgi:choline-sulfatase